MVARGAGGVGERRGCERREGRARDVRYPRHDRRGVGVGVGVGVGRVRVCLVHNDCVGASTTAWVLRSRMRIRAPATLMADR